VNCPHCGTFADVLSTRKSGDAMIRRRRCQNEHRFSTYERVSGTMEIDESKIVIKNLLALGFTRTAVARIFNRTRDYIEERIEHEETDGETGTSIAQDQQADQQRSARLPDRQDASTS
jgi:transcriptional regulator NrdR family protein